MVWLGRIPYREAWERQHALVAARIAGKAPDTLLLLEHPAVLTLGRHSHETYVRAEADLLAERGIELIRVERGGEVTYHGPGQLVAYAIVKLADRGLLIRPFVRVLERAMIETAATYGVAAGRLQALPGVWCDPDGPLPRKLGALGVRIERGVSYHGIALNVTTDLADFSLIDPCGMPGIGVTSIAREAGWPPEASRPSTESVEEAARRFALVFERALDEASQSEVGADAGGADAAGGGAPRVLVAAGNHAAGATLGAGTATAPGLGAGTAVASGPAAVAALSTPGPAA